MNLNDYNTEIARLNAERAEFLNKQNKFTEDSIKSLDWTKDCDAELKVLDMWSYGLPRFTIDILNSPKIPQVTGTICVMGDDSMYQNNMMFSSKVWSLNTTGPQFYTSNRDTLLKFLRKAKFRSLKGFEDNLKLYNDISEAINENS